MNRNMVIGVILVLLIFGGYFLYQNSNKAPASVATNQEVNTQQPADQSNTVNVSQDNGIDVQIQLAKNYEVKYTDSGYTPSELKIKAGDTVTFKNESTHEMWVGSAMHPTHAVYSGTTLQQHCPDAENNDLDQYKSAKPGESWSFTFSKTGTWGYHNHAKANQFGKIIVE